MSKTAPALAEFVEGLEHPKQAELDLVRQIIQGVSPEIEEGIKWNSISFRTTEWFATFNKRATDRIELVLHLGAKVRQGASVEIPDPEGMLRWLAKDRCLLTLTGAEEITAKQHALEAIIRDWIQYV